MSYLAAAAIVTRVREVIEDSLGALRTVPVSRFAGDLGAGGDAPRELGLAMGNPRCEAQIVSLARNAASPPIVGDLAIFDLTLEARVVRAADVAVQTDDDTRDALRAVAIEDADVISQALGWPPNVAATAGGTSTRLVGGLRYAGSRVSVLGSFNEGAQRIETIHTFTGTATSAPAV